MLCKLLVFVHCVAVFSQTINERTVRDYACYGTGSHASMDFNCSSAENILPYELFVGVKNSSLSCPDAIESNTTSDIIQQCCFPNTAEDCISSFYTLSPDTAVTYYEGCVGKETCRSLQPARIGVGHLPCTSTGYMPVTNYMFMNYYCVKESNIARFPNAAFQNDGSGSVLYLQGSNYPSGVAITSITCSVETDCLSTIDVYGLHVNFELDNTTCQQSISIDGEGSTLYTINCANNDKDTGYGIRTILSSNTNYITLNYTSTVPNSGQFWLGFKATGNLTLDCPGKDPENECLTTTTTTTTTTTGPTTGPTTLPSTYPTTNLTTEPTTVSSPNTTTNLSAESSTMLGESKESDESNNTVIIIAVVCGVVVIALVVIIVVFLCKRMQKKKNQDDKKNVSNENGETTEDEEKKVTPPIQKVEISDPILSSRDVRVTDREHGGIFGSRTKPLEPSENIQRDRVKSHLPPLIIDQQTPEHKSGFEKEQIQKGETDNSVVLTGTLDENKGKKKRRKKRKKQNLDGDDDKVYQDNLPKSDETAYNQIPSYPQNVHPIASTSNEDVEVLRQKTKKKKKRRNWDEELNDDNNGIFRNNKVYPQEENTNMDAIQSQSENVNQEMTSEEPGKKKKRRKKRQMEEDDLNQMNDNNISLHGTSIGHTNVSDEQHFEFDQSENVNQEMTNEGPKKKKKRRKKRQKEEDALNQMNDEHISLQGTSMGHSHVSDEQSTVFDRNDHKYVSMEQEETLRPGQYL